MPIPSLDLQEEASLGKAHGPTGGTALGMTLGPAALLTKPNKCTCMG